MKPIMIGTILCMLVAVLCLSASNVFADANNVEILQVEIQNLSKQISELQKTIEIQKAEIDRLNALCVKNGIDISPNKSTTNRQNYSKDNNDPNIPSKLWTSKSTPGDGTVFVFRNCKIGDPKSKKANDFVGKKDSETSLFNYKNEEGLERCVDFSVQYTTNYEEHGLPKYLDHTYFKIGDVEIEYLVWFYYEDKLAGFSVVAKSSLPAVAPSYEKLKARLIAVYDEPTSIEHNIIQNNLGATFPQEVLIWVTPDGPMTLKNPSSQIDKCELYMLSTDVAKKLANKRKEKAEQNSHSTF